ncbi:hypothetical protein AAC387_Pa07g2830 [Persea americana]
MNDLITASFEIARGKASMDRDIELGTQAPMGSAELSIEDFFRQVKVVENQNEKLSKLLKKLQDANEESKNVTNAAAMKAIKQRMEKDIDEVGKVAHLAKSKLDELDRDNLTSRKKPGCGKGSSVDRSRMATTVSLKKKLKEKMSEFQALRATIQEEYGEAIETRVFTVTGTRPDEQTLEWLIENGNSEQIFQRAVQEQGRGQVVDTLAEIQERHDTVRDLEKKLFELQQIFLDMAVLVEAQGDILDNIESQVSNAVDHVQSGTTALHRARNMQKSYRKCVCKAIFIPLFVILAAVVVVMAVIIKPWKKSA